MSWLHSLPQISLIDISIFSTSGILDWPNVTAVCMHEFHCSLCSKHFTTLSTLETHLNSTKHVKTLNQLAKTKYGSKLNHIHSDIEKMSRAVTNKNLKIEAKINALWAYSQLLLKHSRIKDLALHLVELAHLLDSYTGDILTNQQVNETYFLTCLGVARILHCHSKSTECIEYYMMALEAKWPHFNLEFLSDEFDSYLFYLSKEICLEKLNQYRVLFMEISLYASQEGYPVSLLLFAFRYFISSRLKIANESISIVKQMIDVNNSFIF